MKKKNEIEFGWNYLSYVTLKDILNESKGYLSAWVILSIVTLLFGGVFNFSAEVFGKNNIDTIISSIPTWVWLSIVSSWFCWAYRGEEIKFSVPNFSFKSWLFVALLMSIVFLVFENFEWWVSVPFYFGIIILVQISENLVLKGKCNYEAIKQPQTSK